MTKVYPELRDVYAEVKAIIENENCSSCTANRHAEKILKELIRLPYNGRDLSLLSFYWRAWSQSPEKRRDSD